MSDNNFEPFDEVSYLALLDRLREKLETGYPLFPSDLDRLMHLTPKLIAENIRLRERARRAIEDCYLLSQGQLALRLEDKR